MSLNTKFLRKLLFLVHVIFNRYSSFHSRFKHYFSKITEKARAYAPRDGISRKTVLSFSKGNKRAFRKICRRYGPTLYCVACRYLGSERLALQVVEDSFRSMWEKRGTFNSSLEVETELFLIVKETGMKYIRRNVC